MFSIKESIKYGWNKSKEHLELVLFSTLLVLAAGSIINVLYVFAFIFLLIVRIGYTKMFLRIHDGESPKFTDIFAEYRLFWKYLGAGVLNALAVIGGLILLIVPGIFWAVRFSFSLIIVVDTKMGAVQSMKESYAITRGHFWHLLGFWIVIGLFNLAGAIVFGIGLLITVPVSTLASVQVYRALRG